MLTITTTVTHTTERETKMSDYASDVALSHISDLFGNDPNVNAVDHASGDLLDVGKMTEFSAAIDASTGKCNIIACYDCGTEIATELSEDDVTRMINDNHVAKF